jgi:hypothetical protein
MTTPHNPALYEEPRNQSMKVIPPILRESLLTWLERTGRFLSSEIDEFQDHRMPEELDDILEAEGYMVDDDDTDESEE